MRTLVVDDEPLALDRMLLLCEDVPEIEVIGAAGNGQAALSIARALAPDLLLLDISMPDMDGIQLAHMLEAGDDAAAIIFCTAFADFAVAAFDVAAVDYLLKPISLDRLRKAVARVGARAPAPRSPVGGAGNHIESFWVSDRERMLRISASDIDRIEAERDYMRLHVGPRSYLLHETITTLEQKLHPTLFLRIHRSSLIRRDRIAHLKRTAEASWAIELKDGTEVKIGRTYLEAVRASLRGP